MIGSLLLAEVILQLLPAAHAQQDFTGIQVPTFSLGVFYPARSTDPMEAEVATCRAITDRIDRNSARFNSELVLNTNPNINFRNRDSQLMTSRMQSSLDTLAQRYLSQTSRRMTILKAWSAYPDPELTNEPNSLHYEGGKAELDLMGYSGTSK